MCKRKRRDDHLPATCPPALSPLDTAVLHDGNTWAGRAAIAKEFAVPMGVVESRFHRLRAQNQRAPTAPPAPRLDAVAAPVPPELVRFNWTPARIAEARQLRRRGLTDAQIAARFGVTKGAVWVKLRREATKAKAAREAAE